MSSNTRDALTLIADNTPFRSEDVEVQTREIIAGVPDDPEPVTAPQSDTGSETDQQTGTGSVSGTVSAPAS